MKSSRYLGLVTWVALTYSRIYNVFAQTTTAVVSSLRLAKDGFRLLWKTETRNNEKFEQTGVPHGHWVSYEATIHLQNRTRCKIVQAEATNPCHL